jgi:hypothetical protein
MVNNKVSGIGALSESVEGKKVVFSFMTKECQA